MGSNSKRSRVSEAMTPSVGLQVLPRDLQTQAMAYLDVKSLLAVRGVSTDMGSLTSEDNLWRKLALTGGHFGGEKEALALIKHLRLQSYSEVVEVLEKVGVPQGIVGFWRARVSSSAASSFLGELLCIQRAPNGFLCSVVSPEGLKRKLFRVLVQRKKLGLKGLDIKFVCLDEYDLLHQQQPAVSLRREQDGFSMLRGSTWRQFCKLPEMPERVMGGKGLEGLWSAPYGSHGVEILQLSTFHQAPSSFPVPATTAVTEEERSSQQALSVDDDVEQDMDDVETASEASDLTCHSCDEDEDGDEEFYSRGKKESRIVEAEMEPINMEVNEPKLFLRGDKVLGDPHVPSGRCSFVVDLDVEYDIDMELQMDSRIFVSFPPSGATLGSLAARRDKMDKWFRGKGQINRVAGQWAPEWIDVDFVTYTSGPVLFSVVWSEPHEAFRVVVDFKRLDQGTKWPSWSA
ncbi:unnamed protein product [Chrysoparadoxa australica]